jgi:hypothetical protein
MWGYLCCFVVFCSSSLFSQTLLQDDFEYPADDSLTSHGWSAHASAATNPINVVTPGLSYAGHPGSGVGNAARLFGSGQDVNHSITGTTNADVFVSFLVLVNDATTGSDEYFLHLSTGTHAGKVFVRKTGGMIAFGLAKSSDAAIFTDAVYSLGTEYLIALQYSHVSGSANDTARLFIAESGIPAKESAPVLGPITSSGSEPSEINALALRQGLSAVPDIVVDAIRVSTSWNDAGLPVTFSRFSANSMGNNVMLEWRTETEVENYGFEIERREMGQILTDTYRYESENDGGSKTSIWPDKSTSQRQNETTSQRQNETTNQRKYGSTNQRQDEPTNQQDRSPFTVHHSPWSTVGFVPGSGTSSSPRDYSFVDKPDQPGRYAYRIKQIDRNGTFTYTSTLEVLTTSILSPNPILQTYPNPFNPSTTIRFSLEEQAHTNVRVYDMAGRMVQILANEVLQPGWHAINFTAEGLASGTYLVRLEAGGKASIQRISLLR